MGKRRNIEVERDWSLRGGLERHTQWALCALLVLSIVMLSLQAGHAEDGDSGAIDMSKPLTLENCIKTAIVQSPYIKIDSLSIQMKELNAENEWFRMFPKVNMGVSVNSPVGGSNENKTTYSLTLTSGEYDPISAYLGHDAALEMVALAKYAKLKTAAELIENISVLFCYKETHEAIVAGQTRLEELAREQIAYTTKMFPNAPMVPLEVRIAEQRVKKILAKQQREKTEYVNRLMRLKRMLGIPAEQKLALAADTIDGEFFAGFNPVQMTYDEVREGSIFEKMNRLKEKLAEHGVIAAWADYVPKFTFSVRAPDPVNSSNDDDSYYLTFGATVPLFHWGELGRNVESAKHEKLKTSLESKVLDMEREDAWYEIRSQVSELKSDLDIIRSEIEIRKLAVRRAEILFNSGKGSYQELTEEKMALAKAEIQLAYVRQFYLVEKMKAYSLSGEMLNRFIQVENFNEYHN